MKTRDYLQENQVDMGTSGTLTYNLDYSDPITEINLLFEATNGSDSNKDNPIERNISKIEITDGGQVLWDLPGDVALAYWTHLNQGLPHCYRSGAVSDSQWQTIPLRFGRHTYDPQFAFMPAAHKNPQLRITFDEATVRAAGTLGFVSDSWNLSLLVKLMEDASPPDGFLSCREVETYTALAAGDVRTEMPTDKLIRAIMVRAYESGNHHSGIVSQYRLSCDGGKFVPFNLYSRNMRDNMGYYFKPITVPQYTKFDNGEAHQSWIGDAFHTEIRANGSQRIVAMAQHSGSRIVLYNFSDAGAAVNGGACNFAVTGLPFHNLNIYPFGRLDSPEEWFRAMDYNKLDLFLTNGNAGGEINVCVQQFHSY